MCGIAGLVCRRPDLLDRAVLESMTRALRHRGPDAEGFLIDGRVGLGHRRLSIIDTSDAANQPLYNEDGSVAVILNGEIYNFRELRAELEASGHRFRTRSDSEVIVHAWEEFGSECPKHLLGMFAFAVYDSRRRKLFIVRDRLGKKPLYYSRTSSGFAFASEIKALRRLPEASADLDLGALCDYVAYGNSLGERSIFATIRRLLPAHHLTLDLARDTPEPVIKRYWELHPGPDEHLSESDWLDRLDSEISRAVRMRLVSDVPLGAFLSGGIDSSLVVAYMAEHSPEPVKTFTMAFGEASHDESGWARKVAAHFGCEHHEEWVTPDAVAIVDSLIDVYDEPFGDESAIPTFYLSRMTRQGVTVALSGDGGDENFLGYPRYTYSLHGDRIARLLSSVGRSAVAAAASRLPWRSRFKRPLERLARSGFDHYHHAMGHSTELTGMLRPEIHRAGSDAAWSKILADDRRLVSGELLKRFSWSDLHNYLPDDILVKVDRASMHNSLEVRCPLLDHRLVESARRIPSHLNLKGLKGKRLLRTLLHRRLSDDLTGRPKQGFGVPLAAWLRGELAPMVDAMLQDTASPMWQYFDRSALEERSRAHRAGPADLHVALWRGLYFHRWAAQKL